MTLGTWDANSVRSDRPHRQQGLNQPPNAILVPWQRRRPSPLSGNWADSTFVKMVEPTEVNANRSARLSGGRMSLDEVGQT